MSPFSSWRVAGRARGARLVLIAGFLVLAGAFFNAQVLQSAQYRLTSESNRLRAIPLPAPRGEILDRNGLLIAENVPGYTVRLHASREDSLRSVIRRLDSLLPLDSIDVEEVVARWRGAPYLPAQVLSSSDFNTVSVLQEHRVALPGLVVQAEPRRRYADSTAMGHLLGYVGEISARDLEEGRYPGARMGDIVGKQGLELEYDSLLRGRHGVRYVQVTATGHVVRDQGIAGTLGPETGRTITSTIDLPLQRFVDSMWRATPFLAERAGALIAMRPDGQILAYYSHPTIDPNAFIGGISRSRYAGYRDDPQKPLFDRVIQGLYPPASPFKLAVAAIGLKRGLITMDTRMPVPCTGGLQFGRRFFRCWKRDGGHGSLDLAGAIATSCDVYFYQLGVQLTPDVLMAEGDSMGFDSRSGIDLELEHSSRWPTAVKEYVNSRGQSTWNGGETLNLSIGQGANVQSLINMTSFYAALGNDGVKRAPYLVAPRAGAPEWDFGLTPEQLAGLRASLSDVVTRGTAGASGGRLLEVGGKTGTGQMTGQEDAGWFIGFAPVSKPEIVVGMVVEEGLHGSTVAKWVVQTIRRHIIGPDSVAIKAPVDLPITEDLNAPVSQGSAGITP